MNAIAEALDGSLNNEKAREKCCRALLILCGHFSSTGKIPTKTSILKQAGYNHESVEVKPHGHQKEGQQSEVTISLVRQDIVYSCVYQIQSLSMCLMIHILIEESKIVIFQYRPNNKSFNYWTLFLNSISVSDTRIGHRNS